MNNEELESWRVMLSKGAIPAIIRNCLKTIPVCLQVLGCKAVEGVRDVRYGLVISDGEYSFAYGMLPKRLNHLVEEGELEPFTIIKLKQFVTVCPPVASGPRVGGKKEYEIYLWDIVPLQPGTEVGAILGNPRPVFDEGVCTAAVPTATNNFVPFDQLPNLEVDSIIDVIGLVLHLHEMVLVNSFKVMRSLTADFVDSTNTKVDLSLLEKVAENCIVALRGVKISNKFGRRYLEILSSTVVQVDPDMSEARELREWYVNRGNVV